MKKYLFVITGLFLLLSVYSQNSNDNISNFGQWDNNSDGKVTFEEYFNSIYFLLDENLNGDIDEEEFNKSYQLLTYTDTSEQQSVWLRYGAGTENQDYLNNWDADASQSIAKAELYNHLPEIFGKLDRNKDNYIDEEEFSKTGL